MYLYVSFRSVISRKFYFSRSILSYRNGSHSHLRTINSVLLIVYDSKDINIYRKVLSYHQYCRGLI